MSLIKNLKLKLKNIFPIPKLLTFDVYGIDLSSNSIRVVKLRNTTNGYIPEVFDEIILNQGCKAIINGEGYEECEEYSNSLNSLVKKYNIEYVVASLPEEKTYIYKTRIPIQAHKDLEDAVSFTLEENVPFKPDDVCFDFRIVDFDKEFINVVVFAVSKSTLNGHMTLLRNSNLTPVSFETESQALAQSIIKSEDSKTYLIISMNQGTVRVSIAKKGIVEYSSTFPVETDKIIKDFESKEMFGLVEQLNKLLVYWFTNNSNGIQNEKIKVAILAGAYANTEGLSLFFKEHLKIDIEIANVWTNCFNLDNYIPPLDKGQSLVYGVSVGLSLSSKK